jgi:hypothetical protein
MFFVSLRGPLKAEVSTAEKVPRSPKTLQLLSQNRPVKEIIGRL